jgi:HD-GYP domain-containing protein (c-di-GMP phosphodiesterase class II)
MEIAGYLHDIGKLAVPNYILEKSGQLSTKEWRVVHAHSYYTHSILDRVIGFEDITRWASNHHETLDGKGYPFGHSDKELCIGSRIMMVADIFTALAEDRPYRKGLNEQKIQKVFFECVQKNKLDPLVTEALLDNYKIMNNIRIGAQVEEAQRLKKFWGTATPQN